MSRLLEIKPKLICEHNLRLTKIVVKTEGKRKQVWECVKCYELVEG